MAEKKKKDSRLERAGVSGYNKPKRTPSHPTKSHVVVAKVGDKVKMTDDAINNYGEEFNKGVLTIVLISKNENDHPGYDKAVFPCWLYDFEECEFSLYDYEIEYA